MKSQDLRLVDVFILGPFMVWASQAGALPKWARFGMAIGGALTIAYNARNYTALRK